MRCYITYPAGVPCVRCRSKLVDPCGPEVCGPCQMREITEAFLHDLRAGLKAAFRAATEDDPR